MNTIEIFIVSLALAMDAFAVSVSCGLCTIKRKLINTALKAGISFGLFQGIMTALGWLFGSTFQRYIQNIDHWVALVLLGFIGVKMIKEAFEENNESIDLNNLKVLLVLSIATSIDALAAGITFSSLKIKILLPSLSIGFITFVLCFIGVYIGCRMSNSSKIRGKLDIFGGSILIIIGLKIFIEHMFF